MPEARLYDAHLHWAQTRTLGDHVTVRNANLESAQTATAKGDGALRRLWMDFDGQGEAKYLSQRINHPACAEVR